MQPVSVPTSLLIFKDLRVRGFWMSRDGALPTEEVDILYIAPVRAPCCATLLTPV